MQAAPRILGIVNTTEDSFSDGGRYLAPEAAIAQARRLVAEGADIVDLGPASSAPGAAPVSAAEEIRRLAPVVEALRIDEVSLSVDSFLPETQAWALDHGVSYLNDIQGFSDEALYPRLAAAEAKLILMHSVQGRGIADRRPPPKGDIVAHICGFFERRLAALAKAGIGPERVILDPGMGLFLGNEAGASFSVLARLGEIKGRFGLPVLVSVSRKSFLRKATGRGLEEIGPATLVAELMAAERGADYIRTHEPGPLRDALAIWAAVKNSATIR